MPQPNKIPLAFAASGDKNSIPESTETTGLASWREGFPAITSAPFSEGGVAPKRADFNGIFNALSLATLWQQQGGFYAYDATTDYEVGNVVEYSGDLYKCLSANGPGSAVKAPTDTTVWDAIATASGYLPLSGGAMSGDISNGKTPYEFFRIYGGTSPSTGARLALAPAALSGYEGEFWLVARDSNSGDVALKGRPNGELIWNNRYVATIQAGTWTPVLVGNSIPGTYTYKQQNGTYIKIGDLVYITADIDIGAYSVHPYGRAYIAGLPFAVLNDVTTINVRGMSGLSNSFFKCTRGVTGNGYTRIFLQGIDQSNNVIDDLTFSNSSQTSGRYLSLASPSGTNTTGHIVLSGVYRSQ